MAGRRAGRATAERRAETSAVAPDPNLKWKHRWVERVFGAVALLIAVAVLVGFARYISNADGAARVSALFAGGLVLVAVWLLLWAYVRRPPAGQDDDYLDKFLAGAGQALLLGAVLSFGFGVVGQRLEDERASSALRRDLAGQVRADAGGKSFSGLDLQGEWFAGLNLSDFDLTRANLSGANLYGAELSDAVLFEANLSGADLGRAKLPRADLRHANLSGADLGVADLSGAHLSSANLSGADLVSAKLPSAWLFDANLSGADVTDTNLTGANLTGANLTGANLYGANLYGVILTDTKHDAATVWPDGFDPPPSTPDGFDPPPSVQLDE